MLIRWILQLLKEWLYGLNSFPGFAFSLMTRQWISLLFGVPLSLDMLSGMEFTGRAPSEVGS